jgi:hypothetical protein
MTLHMKAAVVVGSSDPLNRLRLKQYSVPRLLGTLPFTVLVVSSPNRVLYTPAPGVEV